MHQFVIKIFLLIFTDPLNSALHFADFLRIFTGVETRQDSSSHELVQQIIFAK